MDFKAAYSKLITKDRPEKTTSPLSETLVGAASSDRSRILYSAAFRRLQMKAQVFPLEDNAAVRSRLTHSLEVSDIGRSIARKLTMDSLATYLDPEVAIAFVDVVETACLMHDIGNPPFGHFGEEAVQRWFRGRGKKSYEHSTGLTDWETVIRHSGADFLNFDGNPQGFRVVSQLQYGLRPGMNLTFTQLFAGIKYPRSTREADKKDSSKKKAGYFSTEEALFERMRTELGIEPGCRHPLSYIMEAADDIAYCMSDIEDGFEKDLINLEEVGRELKASWDGTKFSRLIPEAEGWGTSWEEKTKSFLKFKTAYAREMVESAAAIYVANHEDIICGKLAGELFGDSSDERKVLKGLKAFARKHLFRHEDVENLELAGFSIISGLLDHYGKLLELPKAKFDLLVNGKWQGEELDVEWRLYNRLPKKHLHLYGLRSKDASSATEEWCLRAHLIIDYISGMTDRFALSTFQALGGTRIA